VEEVTRARPTLGHLLADAVVLSDEGGRLTVSLPNGNAFAHDLVRQQANRQLVLEAARRVRPEVREVQFTTGAAAARAAEGGAPVTSHPAVQAAVELFDGEVTDIRPAARGGRREPVEDGNASPDSGEVT